MGSFKLSSFCVSFLLSLPAVLIYKVAVYGSQLVL